MKEVSKDLESYLNTAKNMTSCDLYELTLFGGETSYYADTDMDITYDGHVYAHNALLIKRDQIKLNSSVVVDTMTITIHAGQKDAIGKDPILKAAHDGVLDRAKLQLRRCFFRDTTIIGCISLFGGTAEVKSAGGIKLQLSVKAKTQGLNMQFPIRKYYPQGTYSADDKSQVISSKDTDDTCLIAPFVPRKEVLI
ncbi:baseplate hub protein [Megasphaera vaginalis (ex Bordigoni et al. 2020)]|uniref:baseplate hub domain-containing protein n=1 Tax=Megasphaera vaginalis (ex Bordigoni et al. 2020) TaxID=2045301 RepID=UPI000C7DFBB7|nr:DUF2163 domain-containing protein [Megasphaera vaginalis (ex Bordigoni et al. 2020)]